MKYRLHIEADVLVTLEEGEVQDVPAYLEQFGYDCFHVPDDYLNHVDDKWCSVDWEKEDDVGGDK